MPTIKWITAQGNLTTTPLPERLSITPINLDWAGIINATWISGPTRFLSVATENIVIQPGWLVTGENIPVNTYVASFNPTTAILELTNSTLEPEAYFRVSDGVGNTDFVIKLTDPVKIQNARDQLNNVVPKLHLTGLIIKSTASYNPNYSYHYHPDTIDFFEVAMEVCDATFNYTEDNLADAGGAFLPGL